MKLYRTLLVIALSLLLSQAEAQMAYEFPNSKALTVGSYGRIGVDWSFENNGSIGRRLNLNNMGSIGGRLEEQDYLEFAPALSFKPFKESDSTRVFVQTRLSVYSNSLSLIGNSSTSALGGLTIAMPELFVAAQNINNTGLNLWVGARLYRGPDIHIADHRYFNDHSGQGFGVEYKNTRFAAIFVSSTDTNSTVPPYFYLNIATGTPSLAMRQRTVWTLQHDLHLGDNQVITLLGEYHKLGNSDQNIDSDTINPTLNYPSDYGWVAGLRHEISLDQNGSYNRSSIRYGTRLANGGDGGLSRTWLTFGAPDTVNLNFEGAYSLSIAEELLLNFSNKHSLNAYIIYTQSKGAADGNGLNKTFFGREVYNRKEDFTVGLREVLYLSDKVQLMGELHFSQRKDGDNPWYRMTKFSIAPTLVPTGHRNYWARPQIRLIASVAKYNDYAKDNLYSPYLAFVGPQSWGYFFGIKAEWWIWD